MSMTRPLVPHQDGFGVPLSAGSRPSVLAEADPAEAASAGSTAAAPRATTIAALILRLAPHPPSPSIVLVPRVGRGPPVRWVNARPAGDGAIRADHQPGTRHPRSVITAGDPPSAGGDPAAERRRRHAGSQTAS
jgi:hypothetical protein